MTPREVALFVVAVVVGAPAMLLALPWLSWVVVTYCVALGGCQ